jgi:hypothetical protein
MYDVFVPALEKQKPGPVAATAAGTTGTTTGAKSR